MGLQEGAGVLVQLRLLGLWWVLLRLLGRALARACRLRVLHHTAQRVAQRGRARGGPVLQRRLRRVQLRLQRLLCHRRQRRRLQLGLEACRWDGQASGRRGGVGVRSGEVGMAAVVAIRHWRACGVGWPYTADLCESRRALRLAHAYCQRGCASAHQLRGARVGRCEVVPTAGVVSVRWLLGRRFQASLRRLRRQALVQTYPRLLRLLGMLGLPVPEDKAQAGHGGSRACGWGQAAQAERVRPNHSGGAFESRIRPMEHHRLGTAFAA